MKHILLLMIIPTIVFAQEPKPIRHYDLANKDKKGFFSGEMSISPGGKYLIATFNDMADKSVYELINLSNMKLVSSGSLISIPFNIAWKEDEKLVAMEFKKGNVACYNVDNLNKPLFETRLSGVPVFGRKYVYAANSGEPPLFVLGADSLHAYETQAPHGFLKGYEFEGLHSFEYGWFDLITKKLEMLDGSRTELSVCSKDGAVAPPVKLDPMGSIKDHAVDNEGTRFLLYDELGLKVFDTYGKLYTSYDAAGITAACFVNGARTVAFINDNNELYLLNMAGKLVSSARLGKYYSNIAYNADGSELIAFNNEEVDIYQCKNNLPVVVAEPTKAAETDNSKPVIKEEAKPVQAPVAAKWNLPFTISDFITPKLKDSFYLYNKENSARFFLKYNKIESGSIWKNPFAYYQYFGLGDKQKYETGYFYTLDLSEGEAKMATYHDYSKKEGDMVFGGNNFLAKLAPNQQPLTWNNKMFDDFFDCSSELTENSYHGSMGKCLMVEWTNASLGPGSSVVYFFQKGVGLVKIITGGQTFERK